MIFFPLFSWSDLLFQDETSTSLCISSSDSQRLRPTIHKVITSKIKAHAKLVNSSRYGVGQTARSVIPGLQFMKGHLESYQLPKQKRQNGISLAGTLLAVSLVSHVMAPTGKAQAAAKELLDSILDTVVRIFGGTEQSFFLYLIICESFFFVFRP